MKSLLLLAIFILFCHCSLDAQWYNKACGVQDIESATPDEFTCMWKKATTTVKVGRITCAVGGGLVLAGGLTMLIADPCCSSGYFMTGALGIEVGLVVVAVSIPIWSVGASRRNKLRATPAYQEPSKLSFELTPRFEMMQLTQRAAPGIALTCRF